MTQNEFMKQQQAAIQLMREMNEKANNSSPTKNTSIPPPQPQPQQQKPNSIFQNFGFELPFSNFFKDKDTALILGLLLILYGEKADKMLLFALIYILL